MDILAERFRAADSSCGSPLRAVTTFKLAVVSAPRREREDGRPWPAGLQQLQKHSGPCGGPPPQGPG